jgi:hypothetical protein
VRKKISAEWGISRAALSGELLPVEFCIVLTWLRTTTLLITSAKRGSIFRNVEPAANIEEIFDLSISGSAAHRVTLTLKITIDPTSATDGPSFPFVEIIADALDTEQPWPVQA